MSAPSATVPLALLPVRLETRFVGNELLILVIPDAIHLDSFEPEFTESEEADARTYWERVWRSGRDEDLDEAAWRGLVARYGPERSAWIARQVRPDPATRPDAPVPAGEPLDIPFPERPSRRPASWTRPPLARLLPTSWKARAWHWPWLPVGAEPGGGVGGTPITADTSGRPIIADRIALGPGPRSADAVPNWLTHFTMAEEVGMGLRLRLEGFFTQRIHRLVVWGVDETTAPADGALGFADLLAAHYYTDGFSYLTRGTPTNNTATVTSAYNRRDAAYEASYRVRDTDLTSGDADANGSRLAVALGSSEGTSDRGVSLLAAGAGGTPEKVSGNLQALLWGATGGYWLSQMLAPDRDQAGLRLEQRPVTPEEIARTADHVVRYLRPGGPLPPLRIGAQPYGVLPVLAADRWTAAAKEQGHAPVVASLAALRETVWLRAAASQARLGGDRQLSVADAQAALLAILASTPVSTAVVARQQLGHDFVAQMRRLYPLRIEENDQWGRPDTLVRFQVGMPWEPRVAGLLTGAYANPLTVPLIRGAQEPAEYLAALASAELSWRELREASFTGGDPDATPLLYQLARHSALREYADAAILRRQQLGRLADRDHQDPDLVDFRLDGPTGTPWRQLAEAVGPGSTRPDGTPLEIGDEIGGAGGTPPAGIARFRQAAAALAEVPAADLEAAFRETLDGWSHRLDAWLTSYATRRLATVRKTNTGTLVVGGYGLVENLSPRGTPGGAAPATLSDGFVHAPSLAQAVTAGVLRSGYTSHSGGGDNPFAVNLSSARVRIARWVLAGVRNGQSLGTLGGYLFERAVHEADADERLDDFRAIAPSRHTAVSTEGGSPREVTIPSPVVDGLLLRTIWRREESDADRRRIVAVLDLVGPEGGAKRGRVAAALEALDSALDATADLLIAESVHHAAGGNPTRAAATLDALARGDGTVPDPTFLQTPRSAVAVTHRVALVASATAATEGWPGAQRPRVVAAGAAVERIATALLPRPVDVRCAVRLELPGRQETVVVRMADCALSALDCVFETPAAPEPGRPVPAAVELAVREAAAVRLAVPPTAAMEIAWAPQPHWTATDRSVGDLVAASRLVRAALRRGRPLTAADLVPPEQAGALRATADAGLPGRAEEVAGLLRAAAAALADPTTEVSGLRRAVALGIPGAAAVLLPGGQADAVTAVAREVDRRLAAASVPRGEGADPDAAHARRIAAVLGEELPVTRALPSASSAAFVAAVGAGAARLGGSAAPVRHWLQRTARVRPALRALTRAQGSAQALRRPALAPCVVQLPDVATEPWLGERAAVSGARLHLALLPADGAAGVGLPTDLGGVLVDEWTEPVPQDTQQTGVAFAVDTPAAQAPQAILLAVPPDGANAAATWDDDLVRDTVVEALQLAKVRSADFEALPEMGLPAAYLAYNPAGATVSTDLPYLEETP